MTNENFDIIWRHQHCIIISQYKWLNIISQHFPDTRGKLNPDWLLFIPRSKHSSGPCVACYLHIEAPNWSLRVVRVKQLFLEAETSGVIACNAVTEESVGKLTYRWLCLAELRRTGKCTVVMWLDSLHKRQQKKERICRPMKWRLKNI